MATPNGSPYGYPSYQPQTFSTLQNQGVARPPQALTNYVRPTTLPSPAYAPTSAPKPNMDPGHYTPPSYTPPAQPAQPAQGTGYAGPNLEQMWRDQMATARQQNFQVPGSFNGYQPANYDPGAYHSAAGAPQAQGRGVFTNPTQESPVNAGMLQQIMQGLQNPSRYGAPQAQQTFDLLNRGLTQQGSADKQRIDEDMARRGIYASTTAGGRLGDLASNLNQQRSDFATQVALDQAKNYQGDRASAIAQALGYGGQQFDQGLAGFNANQGAGQQAFGQQATAAQLANDFGNQQYQNNFNRDQFRLGQNAQNFGQQAQQYGLNLDRFNAGLAGQQQSWQQQLAALMGLQGFGQQSFDNQMTQAQFNNMQQQQQFNNDFQLLGAT